MSDLSATPVANRVRVSFFGRRNAGKSTLINALTGQSVAIVSDVPGTTTDPVSKTLEILPLGPCLVTDTAGLDDDSGALGAQRVAKSLAVLDVSDIAILVVPRGEPFGETERAVLDTCRKRRITALVVRSKSDLNPGAPIGEGEVPVSAESGDGVEAFRSRLAASVPQETPPPLVSDLVSPGDFVVCVCPIDGAAPKGRLILPQQQVIRDLLECGCSALVCQPAELADLIARVGKEKIRFVITDSQAFAAVDKATPRDVPLTSFSIVFARQKGDLKVLCAGAEALRKLRDGDTVLISEGCTHRRQCGDIGTQKLPAWIRAFTGKNIDFRFSSGGTFPLEPRPALVVHCGGCMLTRRAMMTRLEAATAAGIPIVNYGVAIALMHGITAHPDTCMVDRG